MIQAIWYAFRTSLKNLWSALCAFIPRKGSNMNGQGLITWMGLKWMKKNGKWEMVCGG